MAEVKQSQRIQTSLLNAAEKKVLVWLADRQPRWMTSNGLTIIGIFGSLMIFAGYVLTNLRIEWLWLASAGFIVNWYGDSLDGTLARVRGTQRPLYGYYLDHTVDALNELLMFFGIGLSVLCNIWIALTGFIFYLLLTLNVSMNAHLKSEFKLTYAKLGPTELRLIMIVINTLFILVKPLAAYTNEHIFFDYTVHLTLFDYVAAVLVGTLIVVYVVSVFMDLAEYARLDPPKKK
ncbi:MAG: CDP-alcohol phosphatidyltransferase family protein [Bacteroidales bacterium]|nr:CDP-alcohol phosphatidyltransferase family protein [Bacteroidales bacterium]